MISLEQIKTLDDKVKKAIVVIDDLRNENSKLKQKLSSYQSRIDELERLIQDFKRDQGAIEQGILDAIDQLDNLEHASPAPTQEPVQKEQSADTDNATENSTADTVVEFPKKAEEGISAEEDETAGGETADESDDQDTNELDIF